MSTNPPPLRPQTRRALTRIWQRLQVEASEIAEQQVNASVSQIITQTGEIRPGRLPTLDGDVQGAFGAVVVVAIQGIPVSATDPTDNQVLIYDEDLGAYVPGDQAATSDLDGDVTGPQGETVVVAIQGIPVSTTDPTDEQVLAFDEGLGAYVPTTVSLVAGPTSGYWEPLTNGDPDYPELMFDVDGNVLMTWVTGP